MSVFVYTHSAVSQVSSGPGPSGVYCPALDKLESGMELVREAVEHSGLSLGEDLSILIDMGADRLFDQVGRCRCMGCCSISTPSFSMYIHIREITCIAHTVQEFRTQIPATVYVVLVTRFLRSSQTIYRVSANTQHVHVARERLTQTPLTLYVPLEFSSLRQSDPLWLRALECVCQ